MRYYKIVIRRKDGTLVVPKSMEGMHFTDVSYSSLISGRPNPGALDITVNIPAFFMSAPRQGAMVRLSGVSLEDLSQITHLVDCDIWVYGGMLDGYLPLSKHYPQDLLVQGVLYQTSGNWEPANTTLDIYITVKTTRNPELGDHPNLTLDWAVNTALTPALQQFLQKAYGKSGTNPNGADIKVQISPELIARAPFPGTYDDFIAFSTELKRFTTNTYKTIKRLDGSPYRGVDLYWKSNTIIADDGTQPTGVNSEHTFANPLVIAFTDLIGQPVWKTFNQMVFKCIMRGDISLADYVKLPATLNAPYILTSGGVGSGQAPNDQNGMSLPSKKSLAFNGIFQVQEVLHSGQFRQVSAHSWVTVVDCFVPSAQPSTAAPEEPVVEQVDPDKGQKPQSTSNPADPLRTAVPPAPTQGPPPVFQ